jgi:transposase
MMRKKSIVRLTELERQSLTEIVKKLKGSSQKVRRAQMLLKADANGSNWSDQAIAEAFDCRYQTVEDLRRRFVTEGFDVAVCGKQRKQPPRSKILDGKQEAQMIALRLGSPPEGFAHWSLRLLADKVVELEIADSVSHETLRQMLKKTG